MRLGPLTATGLALLLGAAFTVAVQLVPLPSQRIPLPFGRVALAFRLLRTVAPIRVAASAAASGFGDSGTPQLCQNSSRSTRPANQLPGR